MVIDHIFFVSPSAGAAAERRRLAQAGFTESCHRKHVGIGTESIFFCFDNAFLEVLWIADEEVARAGRYSKQVLERSTRDLGDLARFGIGLRAPRPGADLPFDHHAYPPPSAILPNPVQVAVSSDDPAQPLIFRAQRTLPPAAWVDGLAGERQTRGGFANIDEWRFEVPVEFTPSRDLERLSDERALMLVKTGVSASLSILVSRSDGGPPRRFMFPALDWC